MSECESTIGYLQRTWQGFFKKGSAEDRKPEPQQQIQSVPGQPVSVRPPDLDTPAWLEINAMNKMVRESHNHLETQQKRVHMNSHNVWSSK